MLVHGVVPHLFAGDEFDFQPPQSNLGNQTHIDQHLNHGINSLSKVVAERAKQSKTTTLFTMPLTGANNVVT
jgi:hypothetical protein